MSAAHDFVAGRGAVPIPELARWMARSVAHVYRAIGRGELLSFGPGRVTADSVVRYYESFNEGGAADEVKQNTSRAVPVAAPHAEQHREIKVRAVTGGASFAGGAR